MNFKEYSIKRGRDAEAEIAEYETQAADMKQKIDAVDNVLETVEDTVAVVLTELYDEWDPNGYHYEVGKRCKYAAPDQEYLLYKCKQEHDSNPTWHPDVATSLFDVVSDSSGTEDDVIDFSPGMELEEGKYYKQFDVTYYCFRSSGAAIYNNLADLVEIYVRVV